MCSFVLLLFFLTIFICWVLRFILVPHIWLKHAFNITICLTKGTCSKECYLKNLTYGAYILFRHLLGLSLGGDKTSYPCQCERRILRLSIFSLGVWFYQLLWRRMSHGCFLVIIYYISCYRVTSEDNQKYNAHCGLYNNSHNSINCLMGNLGNYFACD